MFKVRVVQFNVDPGTVVYKLRAERLVPDCYPYPSSITCSPLSLSSAHAAGWQERIDPETEISSEEHVEGLDARCGDQDGGRQGGGQRAGQPTKGAGGGGVRVLAINNCNKRLKIARLAYHLS